MVYAAINGVLASQSTEQMALAVRAAVAAIGFSRFTLIDGLYWQQTIRRIWHNAPAAWAANADDLHRIRQDPVFMHGAASHAPFTWNRETYARAGRLDLWEQQAAHGYAEGLCASVGPADFRATMMIAATGGTLPEAMDDVLRLHADLYLLTNYTHATLAQVDPDIVKLSPRQVECLTWVLNGKTTTEISMLLDISERVVNQHITRAMDVLGVSKRQLAAIRARQLGLLPEASVA